MSFKGVLLFILPGVAFLIYHAVKSRSAVGIGLLFGIGLVLCVSFFAGLLAGCDQAFCVNWSSGGIRKVEPGVPFFNHDGTVTVEAQVTDEDGQRKDCVFTMAVERVEKDGVPTVMLVEKSNACTLAKS